jgi:hypothetical protein
MKPGDLIEWVYQYNSRPVREEIEIWSTPMQRWIPVDIQPMMLVSITDEFYSWLTPEGLFSVCVDDATLGTKRKFAMHVVPRIVGEPR